MFTPTAQQLAIVEASVASKDNLLVSALAGAAKTTTLELIAKANPGTQMMCLAFNKRIVEEMSKKLPRNCVAKTMNALGHSAWADAIGKKCRVDFGKMGGIFKELLQELDKDDQKIAWKSMGFILRSVGEGKSAGYVPDEIDNRYSVKGDKKYKNTRLMCDDEFFEALPEEPSSLEWGMIRVISAKSIDLAFTGNIDFGDQLLMPTVFRSFFPSFALILVDEAQDLSALNHAMLDKLVKRRIIAVGDQCQPAGTMVSVVVKKADRWNAAVVKKVAIEKLTGEEVLLGYNGEGAFMFNRSHKPVKESTFTGEMITVKTAKLSTKYTDSHITYTSFAPLRNKRALYLMRQGNKFRIGRCAMEYECGSGPTRRAIAENADAYWLLGVFDTEREAAIEEAVAQAQFGIPDITFNCPNQNIGFADQGYLDEAWGYIQASVNLTERATACLDYYHRMIEYPLWETGGKASFSLLRPSVTRACNLISGCLVLPYTKQAKITKDHWTPVEIEVSFVENETVYSLEVSDNNLYIADDIVTHNCQAIYGFRGAHEDGMSRMKDHFSMTEYPLSCSFRCPKAIVEHVQWRAPDMTWWEDNPANLTGFAKTKILWSMADLPEECAVICRNNAPLFALAIELLQFGRYPNLWGNDVAKPLMTTMQSLGNAATYREDALDALRVWHDTKAKRARNKASLRDRARCVEVFLERCDTLGEAIAYAENVLSSTGKIDLLTGHKSKGHEWSDVYILDQQLIGDEGQEPNLRYVMATRSLAHLTYVTTEMLEGRVQDE